MTVLLIGTWGWCPFTPERGTVTMEAGRTSSNVIAATLPSSSPPCNSQSNIILFSFQTSHLFYDHNRTFLYELLGLLDTIQKGRKSSGRKYISILANSRKSSARKDFNRHFNMQLKTVSLPPLSPTFSCLHTDVRLLVTATGSCVCFHVLQGRYFHQIRKNYLSTLYWMRLQED